MEMVNRDPNNLNDYLQQLRDDLRMVDEPQLQTKLQPQTILQPQMNLQPQINQQPQPQRKETPPPPQHPEPTPDQPWPSWPMEKAMDQRPYSYLTSVEFDDVIAEPNGTLSPPCIWRNSKYIFTCSKNCCYRFLSLLCGLPIAFVVGCSFACLTFQHVWCIGPALRQFTINCHAIRQFLRTALDACMGPCCGTLGLVFSRIKVTHHNDSGRMII